MDERYYSPIPCGTPIPFDTPHAFSVSLPTYQDVADYEESAGDIFTKVRQAYPRIIQHPLVSQLTEEIRRIYDRDNHYALLLPSRAAFDEVCRLWKKTPTFYEHRGSLLLALFSSSQERYSFFTIMKWCGYMIFSREAERILKGHSQPSPAEQQQEKQIITDVLREGYGPGKTILTNSGMNAFYSVFAAVKDAAAHTHRDTVIQFGWLYTDSISILRSFAPRHHQIPRVTDLHTLRTALAYEGDRVMAIVTETVSNPLLHTPNFTALKELCREYGCWLIVDNTFATPWNVDISSAADCIIESMTKYAVGTGDTMAGAVFVPAESSFSETILSDVAKRSIPLQHEDLLRCAQGIRSYGARMQRVNEVCKQIAAFLRHHPAVESVYSVYSETAENYGAIARHDEAYGGVLTFAVRGDFAIFYDSLCLPKGPSLGTDFPLLMSYTLLAHWDLVQKEGQKELSQAGISPWLLRLSVGTYDPDRTIAALKRSLDLLL
ncbi:PLP-dependent transferase [Chitinivibrio alkaliphilus]|uniref:Cystathionine gamma-synthase n=1 Tax=Chitinivibrio alkaliphilus ACht1 TaxID=1313304 RepID=U7DC75_9BACT|nr:PLP-dependent transferase [Chitinivibrio alkaliphilus]ERP32020.1 cystathionine gamma-synthase [Chitinivibrio alkaliphilus ACht1]